MGKTALKKKHLNFKKWYDFEKSQNWPFSKGCSEAKSSKKGWTLNSENHTKNECQYPQEIFYGKMAKKKIKYSQGDTILKIGKISHFAKATESQNG